MEVKLVVAEGKHAGQAVPVPGPKFFIGRAEDCHLRPGSDLVSRHHAVILVEEGFVAVRDFGSKNGTFVNGERIKSECELKNGDRLKVGPLEFDVQLEVSVGGKKKPKVHSVQEAAARTVESAAEEEIDILDLLGSDEQPASPSRPTDTMPVTATPTATVDEAQTTAVPEQGPHTKPKKEEKPATIPGRFSGAKKPGTDNTRSAADEVLRQFFGRKR